MQKGAIALLLSLGLAKPSMAIEDFTVEDIRVEGLQRISAGTVFNYLPIKVGDEVSDRSVSKAIRELYDTGFFKDISLESDGTTLVVFVQERPSIASIEIEGNKAIETEQLTQALGQIGFAEGQVYNRAILERVVTELERQYFANGKYGVKIDSEVTPLERNRVAVTVDISEGVAAKIHRINIVGNESFSEEELLDELELTTPTLFSFYTKSDQYSKDKLSGDLEKIRSFYLDRGYINFEIESTQVSITPDKKDIYITININEGERYKVSEVKLAGELIVEPEVLFPLVSINQGDIFSRKLVTATSDNIVGKLGNEGYAFANVNPIPNVNEETKEVSLTFFVDPGNRVYVRRVNVSGNLKTQDKVIRREIRQMENGWISTEQVERSKTRLNKLGYFEEVTVETPPVAGSTDTVDVNFNVTERSTGSINLGAGFSQSQGFIFNASLTQDNFLGTGNRYAVTFNNSQANTIYALSVTDPYFTQDGISRTMYFRFRETDADELDITNAAIDESALGISFGVPINEYDRVSGGLAYKHHEINLPSDLTDTSQLVQDFVGDYGDSYDSLVATASWSSDSRNRAIFPTRGALQSLDLEVGVPGSDLEYYKINYIQGRFFPVTKKTTLLLKGEVGYGDAYGDIDELPPFERYYAGGIGDVRGFEDNSLGPRDTATDDPIGGGLYVVGNAEYIMPVPFVKNSSAYRLSAFVDVGNVYEDPSDFDAGDLRASAGVSGQWLSPFGMLRLSVAAPLKKESGDDTQVFQFSFGRGF